MEESETLNEFNNIIDSIKSEKQQILINYIKDGYIENLAKILAYLGNKESEELLKTLPSELQVQVKDKLVKYNFPNEESQLQVFRILGENGFYQKKFDDYIDVAKNLEMTQMKKTLLSYKDEDPVLFQILNDIEIFQFQDIIDLDDRSIQKILRETDQLTLAKALKNQSSKVQQKIFNNMSNRASSMLKEDMEFMGPVRLSDVKEAQNMILKIIEKLKQDGELLIQNGLDEIVS